MAYEPKTKPTEVSVQEFIEEIQQPQKKEDAYALLSLFAEVTGAEAKMWGPSIIGFGKYHYRYTSGHEGDAPLAAFSPRKTALTFYFMLPDGKREELLAKLGKHKIGKGCVYVNKLSDIDTAVLEGDDPGRHRSCAPTLWGTSRWKTAPVFDFPHEAAGIRKIPKACRSGERARRG